LIKLLSLNLNHRTRPAPISPDVVSAIGELAPDALIFNEYVDQGAARDVRKLLSKAGYEHQAVSDSVEYRPGRWHNQILMASRVSIESQHVPESGPDSMCRTNTLTIKTFGVSITGIRVPAFTTAGDWYGYWDWLNSSLEGDIAIGDFNADPERPRKWDRVLAGLEQQGQWSRADIHGEWSYRGNNGSFSSVDHILTRGCVTTQSARYMSAAFVPQHTDHAALVAAVALGSQ
jgi:hypothetical protein